MARISTYALDDTLEQDDKIIGTDTSNANATMNFSLQQLGEFYTRTGLADASTVFTFDVATTTYGTTIPTEILDGTIYFNFGTPATLTEIIIPAETNSGIATLPFVNAIADEVIILNQAGAGRGLHYGFYDVGVPSSTERDVEIQNQVRGYRIPITLHIAGATTTGLPTGSAVVTPIGIAGTNIDVTNRLLTDLSNVTTLTTAQQAAFRTAIGAGAVTADQFADQQALEDFITSKSDFRTDIGAGTSNIVIGTTAGTALDGATTVISTQQAADIVLNNTHRTTVTGNPHSVTAGDVGVSLNGRILTVGGSSLTVPGTASDGGSTVLSGHNVTELDDVSDAGSGQIITATERTAITANTAKVGITTGQASEITANTAKVGITTTQASAITANTAKVGITTAQASAITANTAKVGITTQQTTDLASNTTARHVAASVTFSGSGNAITNLSIDPTTQVITATRSTISGGTTAQTDPTVSLSETGYDSNVFDNVSSSITLRATVDPGTGNNPIAVGDVSFTHALDGGGAVTTVATAVNNNVYTATINVGGFDTLVATTTVVFDTVVQGNGGTATDTLTLTRNKTAPSNFRYTSLTAAPALIPYFFRNNAVENGAAGDITTIANGSANGWTVSPTVPHTDTLTFSSTVTTPVVASQTFSFTPAAGATDTTTNLTASETINRINSLRIGHFVESTLSATQVNTLTGWRNITGDDTANLINNATYTVTTIISGYNYFAIPSTFSNVSFQEGPFRITLVQQPGGAVSGFNIYRSPNPAARVQTLTYTITVS